MTQREWEGEGSRVEEDGRKLPDCTRYMKRRAKLRPLSRLFCCIFFVGYEHSSTTVNNFALPGQCITPLSSHGCVRRPTVPPQPLISVPAEQTRAQNPALMEAFQQQNASCFTGKCAERLSLSLIRVTDWGFEAARIEISTQSECVAPCWG